MPSTSTTKKASTVKASVRSEAAPAYKLMDDFAMPDYAAKYPWRSMKVGQAALFEGVTSDAANRIIRAASSTGKRYGMRFATRRFPKTEQYPQGALAIKYVGAKKATKAAKAKKAKVVAPAAPAAGTGTTG